MARATQDLYVFLHGERIGRLVLLRRGTVHLYYDPGSIPPDTPLSLSLPGAQPKMALRLTDDGWHLPTGSLATTHILKPCRSVL